MKKYQQPTTEEVALGIFGHLMAGSVRNDDQTIIDGSTDYDENPVGEGDDAGAKYNPFMSVWDD